MPRNKSRTREEEIKNLENQFPGISKLLDSGEAVLMEIGKRGEPRYKWVLAVSSECEKVLNQCG